MGTQISVMGVGVDLLTQETLQDRLREYLSNDYLNVVHVISIDFLETDEKKDGIVAAFQDADLVIPGETIILTKHHVDVLEAGDMVVKYLDVVRALEKAGLQGKKCYFIMRTKSEAKAIYTLIHRQHWGCECVGIYAADSDLSEEALVNDINAKVPDLIYLGLERGTQEEFILKNKSKLNAKLCLCIGGIIPLILREHPYVPQFFEILHLDKVYTKIIRFPVTHSVRKRIFRRKMANYNSKKIEDDNLM